MLACVKTTARRLRRGLRPVLTQAVRDSLDVMAGMEKRRSAEQGNTVALGVAATQDSIFDWRKLGAQVTDHKR